MTDRDLRPPHQRTREERAAHSGTTKWLLIVLGIAALAYGGWWARENWAAKDRLHQPAAPVQVEVPAPPQVSATPSLPSLPAAEPAADTQAEPGQPQHPLPPAAQALSADDAPSLDRMAREWLGAQALQFLVMPGLAHHVVATVDNLPRGHAAPRLWPLSPVGGQMQTQTGAQGMQIAAANSARYDAVVGFVTSLDPATVVQWYRQAYPVLQQTYEALGYPGQYFNDRLVAVIDHLLQTPQPQEPLALRLVQVQGQVAPQQPWLRYEFADADLQARSAGQKILLRLGSAHRAAITAYLQALRAQIAP